MEYDVGKRSRKLCREYGTLITVEALLFKFALFAEDAAAHLQYGFESFAANLGIFTEPIHACLFDLVLNLLPSTAESSDFCFLAKFSCGGWAEGGLAVDNSLTDAEDVRPCQIGGAHGHLLCDRIDIRDFVDVRCIRSTENREYPFWYRLIARDKALGSQLKGRRLVQRIQEYFENSGSRLNDSQCQCSGRRSERACLRPRRV